MRIFCEIVVQDVLPSVRALLAKELMTRYGMTQQDIGKKLGLSQAAVSQYLRSLRGSRVKILQRDPEVTAHIEKLAGRIASGNMGAERAYDEFCDICKTAVKSKVINTLSKVPVGTEKCTVV